MIVRILLLGLFLANTIQQCTQGINGCIICGGNSCVGCDENHGWYQSGAICCQTNADSFPDTSGGCASCSSLVTGCSSCKYDLGSGEVSCSQCDESQSYFLKEDGSCGGCTEVIPHCAGCAWITDRTLCMFCESNFQMSGSQKCCDLNQGQYPDYQGGCDTCASVQRGCVTCEMSGGYVNCVECDQQQGFQLSATRCCDTKVGEYPDNKGGCSANSCSPGCTVCVDTGSFQCSECDIAGGFYLSGSICCDSTIDQFPDSSGSCDSCGTLITGCVSCTVKEAGTVCSSCNNDEGYEISGSICCHTTSGSIPNGSGGCSNANIHCSAGCSTCSDNDCNSCENGFYLSGNICCDGTNGLFPDGMGNCASCSTLRPYCISCIYDDFSVRCVDCDDSSFYYVSKAGYCDTCTNVLPGCSACNQFGPQTQCLFCDIGYRITADNGDCCHLQSDRYPIRTECWSCQAAIPGCETCAMSGGNVECIDCDTEGGYQLAGSVCCDSSVNSHPRGKSCSNVGQCGVGCTACVNSVCSKCDHENGYALSGIECCDTKVNLFPDGSDSCKPCFIIHPKCGSCEANSSVTSCLICESGFTVDESGKCSEGENKQDDEECPPGCSSCSGQDCTNCENGYALYGNVCCNENYYPNDQSVCAKCSDIQSGCNKCAYNQQQSTTRCLDCDERIGYVLSGTKCCHIQNNQFPDGEGGCMGCGGLREGCLECEYDEERAEVACVSCDVSAGKFLAGGTCVSCEEKIPGCIGCMQFDEVQCVACQEGHQLAGSQRQCCASNQGYYADQSGCSLCAAAVPGCQTCHLADAVQCEACSSGYLISEGQCCNALAGQFPTDTGCGSCSDVIPGCSSCDTSGSAITCSICDAARGYFPDGNAACQACRQAIPGCTSCFWDGQALKCSQCDSSRSYYLSGTQCCLTASDSFPDGHGGCGTCGSLIPDCTHCEYILGSPSLKCFSCDHEKQQFLSGSGDCEACSSLIPGCEACRAEASALSCHSCRVQSGFYPDPHGRCATCSSLIQGCTSCSVTAGVTHCAVCGAGYQLSGNICCHSAAESYPDGKGACSTCAQVIPGCPSCTYTDSFVCKDCQQIISHCIQCRDISTCSQCQAKYYEQHGSCKLCSQSIWQCQECSSSTSCISCSTGYVLTDSNKCSLCGLDQVLSSTGQSCVLCSDIHPNCTACSDQNTCTFCDMGLEVKADGSGCYNCQSIDWECIRCQSEMVCTECLKGYSLNSNACDPVPEGTRGTTEDDGKKKDCPPGCQSCSDHLTCASCGDGYGLEGSSCLTCHPSCRACQGSPNTCTDCYMNAYLQQGQCHPCPQNCLTCTPTECLDCSPGFYVNANECSKCGAFCSHCLSSSECQKCDVGFTSRDGQCVRCVAGCTTCEANRVNECLECGNGYYSDGGTCHLCSKNCFICEDAKTCKMCESGFILNEVDHTCYRACAYPCDNCVPGQPTQCLSCMSGHLLSHTSCIVDNCNSTSSCTSCPRQRFLLEGNCFACEANCDFCSDASKCTQCSPGFFVEGGSCSVCPDGCSTCSSNSNCESCSSGFYLEIHGGKNTGKCKPCSTEHHCKQCQGSATQCTECQHGAGGEYEFLALTCVLETRITLSIELDIQFDKFLLMVYEFQVAFMQSLEHNEYSGKTDLLHITNITQGSAVIHASLDVQSETTKQIYDAVEKLNSRNSISGKFPVLSLKQETVGWTYPSNQRTPTVVTFPFYAIILLIVLPLVIITVVAVRMVCCSKKSSKSDKAVSLEPMATSDTDYAISIKKL